MNADPIMDRFSQPLPVVKCECLCGTVLIEGECDGANCSACDTNICEQCADRNHCRREDCGHVYCYKCAPRFLPADAAGICVTCRGHLLRVETYHRLVAAMVEPLRRMG